MSDPAHVIAITGGIGSGKTTVCELFAERGIPVVQTDCCIHALYRHNQKVRQALRKRYGAQVFHADSSVRREVLLDLVSNDLAELQWLQYLLYPQLQHELMRQHATLSLSHRWYVLEIPLLIELKWFHVCAQSVAVLAPMALRLARLQQRGINPKRVAALLAQQTDDLKRWQRCDYWIYNTSLHATRIQVAGLYRVLNQRYG